MVRRTSLLISGYEALPDSAGVGGVLASGSVLIRPGDFAARHHNDLAAVVLLGSRNNAVCVLRAVEEGDEGADR